MAFMKKKCLFSEVSGVVFSAGKPIGGAEVERYYKWLGPDKAARETVTTDAQGRFSFQAAYDSALLATVFPHNPSIQQEISIRYQGKAYEGYLLLKNNYDSNGELKGKALKLTCDLENEPDRTSGFYGICTLSS